jgi:dihydrodipicolinate synthase/N-acetylneuraminate lyase
VAEARRDLREQLFPGGVSTVWCPLLTHYRPDGVVDDERVLAHLDHVAAWVKGILVPGSTGDGWELTEAERLRVVALVLDQATRLKLQVLIGVLKPTTGSMLASLVGTGEWIRHRTGEEGLMRCLVRRRIGGFVVCAPTFRGGTSSPEALQSDLSLLLGTGLPLALYELPQVTGCSIPPAVVSDLAARYPNFLLFKDSSGEDQVARHAPQPEGLFLVRGAEGDYARWLRGADGCYDGFLLSSANCFPQELNRMERDLGRNRVTDAQKLSRRLTEVVSAAFSAVAAHRAPGNPFATANKAMDHFMAFGPRAATATPPTLHNGQLLSPELLRQTGEILRQHGFVPERGYME